MCDEELKCPYVSGSERCEGWHRGVEDTAKIVFKATTEIKKDIKKAINFTNY